jgi:hypothetical protein
MADVVRSHGLDSEHEQIAFCLERDSSDRIMFTEKLRPTKELVCSLGSRDLSTPSFQRQSGCYNAAQSTQPALQRIMCLFLEQSPVLLMFGNTV